MTEKIKNMEFRDKLFFVSLSLIISGISFLIVQNNSRMNEQDKRIHQNETSIIELRNISENLVKTYYDKAERDKEQDREILELWKSTKRSGSSATKLMMP